MAILINIDRMRGGKELDLRPGPGKQSAFGGIGNGQWCCQFSPYLFAIYTALLSKCIEFFLCSRFWSVLCHRNSYVFLQTPVIVICIKMIPPQRVSFFSFMFETPSRQLWRQCNGMIQRCCDYVPYVTVHLGNRLTNVMSMKWPCVFVKPAGIHKENCKLCEP